MPTWTVHRKVRRPFPAGTGSPSWFHHSVWSSPRVPRRHLRAKPRCLVQHGPPPWQRSTYLYLKVPYFSNDAPIRSEYDTVKPCAYLPPCSTTSWPTTWGGPGQPRAQSLAGPRSDSAQLLRRALTHWGWGRVVGLITSQEAKIVRSTVHGKWKRGFTINRWFSVVINKRCKSRKTKTPAHFNNVKNHVSQEIDYPFHASRENKRPIHVSRKYPLPPSVYVRVNP